MKSLRSFQLPTLNIAKCNAILLLCTLLFLSGPLFAQNNDIIFERINTSHGLTNNTVRRIFQDSKGYLWIGTQDGLNKYDGYKFINYRHDPQDSTSLSNNAIWSIYEDKGGAIWIGTEDGLNLYNPHSENFTIFKYSSRTEQWFNTVFNIHEDINGRFWLGTAMGGLTEFDRNEKTFKHHYIDSTRIAIDNSNVVLKIIDDAGQEGKRLWLGCYSSGLCLYDIEKNTFTQYKHDPSKPASLSNNDAWTLLQDSDGDLWIGTQNGGLNKFDLKKKEFTRYKHDPKNLTGLGHNFVLSLFEDPDTKGNIWIGTANGLNILDKKTNLFSIYKSEINDPSTLSHNSVDVIYKDRSGVIWAGTNGGLDKIDRGRVPFRHTIGTVENKDGLNHNMIMSFAQSPSNPDVLWIGTYGGGLNRYDRAKNRFSSFKRNPKDIHSISNDSVRYIYEDPDEAGEILWIATRSGLNRFDSKNKQFKRYFFNDADPKSISGNFIYQIYETRDGMLWISTSRGLNKFDRKKEIFTRYQSQDTTYVAAIQNLIQDLGAVRKPIAAILQVKDSEDLAQAFKLSRTTNVLMVALGEGTNEMWDYGWLEDEDGKEIWKLNVDESKHAGGADKNRMQIWAGKLDAGSYTIRYIADDSHSYGNWNTPPPHYSHMWGIQIFEIDDKESRLVAQNINLFEEPNSIASSNTTCILEDSYGMLWIGTVDKGLSKFDRKSGHFTNYVSVIKDPTSLSNNLIQTLHEDKNGVLWIGTRGGLNKYESKSNSFVSYTTKDGLPNNIIHGMIEDANGNIWMSTNNGISKFDPDDESKNGYITFINYNIQDGLQYNQYYSRSSYSGLNGELFFGGRNGFVSFFPGKSNPQPPATLLSDFLIFNQSVLPGKDSPIQKHISETENISLAYDQNAFSFEFVALHYSQPAKNKYLYKMEGFDKEWIDGHRCFAPYTNLDPGKYTFRVKSSNSDGIWDEDGTSVSITILPPWWRTIWAYSSYGLFLVALIFGLDRFQRRRLMAKAKERMKIQAAEHRAESAELEARAAKAESERKAKELEEARELQLSMLPRELPQLPNLDIAVYMQTATEVGGDYYDFHVSLDGTLTVVIGDATGHGMKAGTMVTTAKSLFNSYAPNPDILFSLQEITRCIRQMNFNKLSMCLTMLKIKGDKMQISTAGMPPSFIFRRDTRVVEEHLFQAMPLGTMEKFPYEIKDTILNPGDTILLMSDGLPELENESGEMYGYQRIRNGFEDVAERAPEEIISFLKNEGAGWVNNEDPDDDVTFVVIKVK